MAPLEMLKEVMPTVVIVYARSALRVILEYKQSHRQVLA